VHRESKGELRAETARLRKSSVESDILIRAIAAIEDPLACKVALQGLVDGSLSRDEVLRDYRSPSQAGGSQGRYSDSPAGSSQAPSQESPFSHQASSTTATQGSRVEDLPSCFDDLLSWRQCRPHPDTSDLALPPLSLPPLLLDDVSHSQQVDTWTSTGWTRAHVRHLIDALRAWDYLPFCLFCEDLFLQDYDNGKGRFCSPALVHAVLALATRLINESSDDEALLPSGWLSSQVFLEEAKSRIVDAKVVDELPDIQALGLLSLYYLRRGMEADAREFAETFAARITEFCQRPREYGLDEDEYSRSRIVTYCGAISLIR